MRFSQTPLTRPPSELRRKIGPQFQADIEARRASFDSPEIGPTLRAMTELAELGLSLPDLAKMRHYRRGRIMAELRKHRLGGMLLFDPINIRYATDSMNMQVWTLHNLARAAFISSEGYIVLWDFVHCEHMTKHLPLINEVRSGAGAFYFEHGAEEASQGSKFAQEIKDVMAQHGCEGRIAIDRMDIAISQSFQDKNIYYVPGQPIMEQARLIKGPDEIKAMKCAAAACELAVKKMHEALEPGLAEVELWAVLHHENIARGGEWIETRILSSGPRTNPWMQEAGPRIIKDGELLAFDTDLIGLYGMCCDMSRTWLVGDGNGTAEQKDCYQIAYDHINENTTLLKPGISFNELTFKGHVLPEAFQDQKYCVKMHGVGLCDEYPSIYYEDHFIEGAFEGELQPGMTLCVEAYIGKVGGIDGVKLENQILITEDGYENLTPYPYEERLLYHAH
ncbi:M24 family metallopeptidase [Hellea balneolensis]|uniref:M24 family metallopeptidase n=1 Tax=Hellea balneolensis TaxID=287478 RepID=UPI0009FCE051|nr:Xaa-Pro peptidase family protein [Hellea balneolensis]